MTLSHILKILIFPCCLLLAGCFEQTHNFHFISDAQVVETIRLAQDSDEADKQHKNKNSSYVLCRGPKKSGKHKFVYKEQNDWVCVSRKKKSITQLQKDLKALELIYLTEHKFEKLKDGKYRFLMEMDFKELKKYHTLKGLKRLPKSRLKKLFARRELVFEVTAKTIYKTTGIITADGSTARLTIPLKEIFTGSKTAYTFQTDFDLKCVDC